MKNRKSPALAAVALFAVACGATQCWDGTYTGSGRRAATLEAIAGAEAHPETWTITDESGELTVVRKRGSETCTMQGRFGSDRSGGYGMELTSGQRCTLDNKEYVLFKGDLNDGGEKFDYELDWSETEGGNVVLFERGELIKQ